MNSQKALLDMVATEAAEAYSRTYEARDHRAKRKQPKPIKYDLRLVREPDGTLTWED